MDSFTQLLLQWDDSSVRSCFRNQHKRPGGRTIAPSNEFSVRLLGNRSPPRKRDWHKFPGNCSAVPLDRIERRLKNRGKIEPVPEP
jgi:hypothetical protein